ncbi:adhesion G-protein coupled receptor G7-like [Ischnura elegans]|uniref:adhesion G-protein coupled receptor G7-like n=1 Tax=Ischnura elegans TaxID=197161 RepID=UPI001ED8B4D3|nr:adhesion G-protein coupled receptor G7-like [Ischnura elegans]
MSCTMAETMVSIAPVRIAIIQRVPISLLLIAIVTEAQMTVDPVDWSVARMELVPVKEDTGAELNIYNVPENELTAANNVECIIRSWVHQEKRNFSIFNNMKTFQPRFHSSPVEWYIKGVKSSITLQTKIVYFIEINNREGLLSCHLKSRGLNAEILYRLMDAVTVLFTLTDTTFYEVRDLFEDYMSENPRERITYSINDNVAKTATHARVSFRGLEDEFQGEELDWSERISDMRNYFEKRRPGAVNLRSTRYCHPERENGMTWPKTPQGGRTLPVEPCPNSDGTIGPLRSCQGDFFEGVYWEPLPSPKEYHVRCLKPTQRLERLSNLSLHMEQGDSLEKLAKEVEQDSNLSAIEITFITRVLTRVAEKISDASHFSRGDIVSVLKTADAVLDSNPIEIIASDNSSGTLKDLRLATEKLMMAAATKDVEPVSLEHVSGFSAHPEAGVRGFKGYQKTNDNGTTTVDLEPIFWNEDKENENASMVFMLLQKLDIDSGITAIVYHKNSLYPVKPFESFENITQIGPTVVISSHKMDGTKNKSPLTILLLFSRGRYSEVENSKCVFWKESARHWTDEGCRPVNDTDLVPPDMFGCICLHLTDFALLVSLPPKNGEWEIDDALISTVHIVCTSISLVCLLAIFLYAALCPSWCKSLYVKINMNLSASVTLSLTICVVEEIRRNACPECGQTIPCITLGGLQHYFLVASFCWVVVLSAFLATKIDPDNVLRPRMTHLLLRSSIVGWGVPVIPVAVTMGIDTRLYIHRPGTAFCFPDGNAFYFGVLTPTAAAMLTTIVAFAFIMWTLFCYKSPVPVASTKPKLLRRLCTALILLFSLGFYWLIALPLQLLTWNPTAYRYFRLFVASTVVMQGTSQFLLLIAFKKSAWTRLSERLSTISSNLRSSLSSAKERTVTKDNSGKFIAYISRSNANEKTESSNDTQVYKQR